MNSFTTGGPPETGTKKLNTEHGEILKLLHAMKIILESIQDEQKQREHFLIALGNMTEFLRSHICEEEKLAASSSSPTYALRSSEHQAILNRLANLERQVRSGETALVDLLNLLGNILYYHVQTSDPDMPPSGAGSKSPEV